MSGWIPTSERLPTEADGESFDVTLGNGSVGERWPRDCVVHYHSEYRVMAWKIHISPDPYVPPEPEKPKRTRLWRQQDVDCEEVDGRWRECQSGKATHPSHRQAIEVLPGDPDPDKAIKVREELLHKIETYSLITSDDARRWAELLKGHES